VKTEGAIESRIRITVPDVLNPDGSRRMPRQYECSFKADSLGNEYAFVEDDRGGGLRGQVRSETRLSDLLISLVALSRNDDCR
jgi:hypothetical protein